MPGARNRKAPAAKNDTAKEGPHPKKSKQDDEKDDGDDAASSPPMKKGLQEKLGEEKTAADTNTTSTDSDMKESLSTPADTRSTGKRGRPRKQHISHGPETSESGATTSVKKDDKKKPAPANLQGVEESGGVFSPRRSGRSVVPNRRFQDMEMDLTSIGRKRPKEESADTPSQKRVKTSAKKESPNKGKNSPVKSAMTKAKPTGSDIKTTSSAVNTDTSVQAAVSPLSPPPPPPTLTTSPLSSSTQKPVIPVNRKQYMTQKPMTSVKPITHPQSVTSAKQSVGSKILSSGKTVSNLKQNTSLKVAKNTGSCVIVTVSPPSSYQPSSTDVSSSLPSSTSVSFSSSHSSSSEASKLSVLPSSSQFSSTVISSSPTSSSATLSAISSNSETSTQSSSVASSSTVLSLLSSSKNSANAVLCSTLCVGTETSASIPAPSKSTSKSEETKVLLPSGQSALSSSPVSDASPVTVNNSVSVTNSSSLLPQSPVDIGSSDAPQKEEPGHHTLVSTEQTLSSLSDISSQPQIAEADMAVVADASEMEVVLTSDQADEIQDAMSPVPDSFSDRTEERSQIKSPGRVVAKSDIPDTSIVVLQDASGHGHSDSEPSHRSSLLASTLMEASKVAPAGKDLDVSDVMSIVELSPTKKVPVVLAERKQHSGNIVSIVSPEHITQLPPEVETIISSQLFSEGSSVSETENSTGQTTVKDPQSSSEDGINSHQPTDPSLTNIVQSTTCSTDAATEPIDKSTTSCETSESLGKTRASKYSDLFSDIDCDGRVDGGERNGMRNDGGDKYVTSGTQTPYTNKKTQKVITVHVHPPSKPGEKNTEIVTVTKVVKEEQTGLMHDIQQGEAILHHDKRGDRKGNYFIVGLPNSADDKQNEETTRLELVEDKEMSESEEGEEGMSDDGVVGKKEKYIVVNLPEGTTVKQPIVRRAERLDSDPDFYTVDDKGLYTCDICQYQTSRRPNFYKHKKKHLGLRPYACEQCPYRAATSSNLKRHQEIHKDIRNHRCPMCDLYFRQKIHLERHIKYRHEEKKVKCPLCDYICANENPDLKVHIKRRHIPQLGSPDAINAFKCRECGVVASSKRDLRQHLKFHNKGPELKLFCNMCSFVTDCESRLRRHQFIHTKEKPFQCGLCDYRGSQKEHVLRHMRTQHNIMIERKHRIKKVEEKVQDSDAHSLLEKADYTSDEKIFACNHCSMKFSKLINLYKHLHAQHRDIMPSQKEDFSCVVCDFRTINKKNLLVHMRRHNVTDQSPPSHVYSCVLCRYMNPKRRNLFQHMRKKHHIEIVMRDDGSSSCFVSNETGNASTPSNSNSSMGNGPPLSPQQSQSSESVVSVLPFNELMSTVSQPSELQVSGEVGSISLTPSTVATPIKIEDLALVVSNPHTGPPTKDTIRSTLDDPTGGVGTFTISSLSQDDAAEAIQGLQALAQRGVLDSGAIVEEQVQVMGSDDQTTLVIDPSGLSLVEQLVQPKTEPLTLVEMDTTSILDHGPSSTTTSLLGEPTATPIVQEEGDEGSGLQLSVEQLMNLSTGDCVEINGEMFKVQVSTDGAQGQQVISFEAAPALTVQELSQSLDTSQVSLEAVTELT